MPWTSYIPVLVWLVLFLAFTTYMFKTPIHNRVTYLALIFAYIAFNLYAILVVNFLMLNYWLRALPVIGIIVFIARFLLLPAHRRWLPSKEKRDSLVPLIASLVVILAMIFPNYAALQSYRFNDVPYPHVLAQWPVQTGMYAITNGGNGIDGLGMSDLYHNWLGQETHSSVYMAYGVDIMKMTIRGMMGSSLARQKNDDFLGFIEHDPVYAPCPGVVVHIENDHPDVQPFSQPQSELGNRVVIQCFEYYITVANLRKGSVPVLLGQRVNFNSQIGMIGNSGTPSVPHLRVFATVSNWNELGTPVPILFDASSYGIRNLIYIGQK